MTDDDADLPGIWVQDGSDRWHWSTGYDGYDHTLACDVTIVRGQPIQDVNTDLGSLPTNPYRADGSHQCSVCRMQWAQETFSDPETRTDADSEG